MQERTSLSVLMQLPARSSSWLLVVPSAGMFVLYISDIVGNRGVGGELHGCVVADASLHAVCDCISHDLLLAPSSQTSAQFGAYLRR
jgi:hypothetical protein